MPQTTPPAKPAAGTTASETTPPTPTVRKQPTEDELLSAAFRPSPSGESPSSSSPPSPDIQLRDRLHAAIIALRNQTTDAAWRKRLDAFLSCLNPMMAVPDRLPVGHVKVVTKPDRRLILENHLAGAILDYGRTARGEAVMDEHLDLDAVELVADAGLGKYGAFPKDRNSAVHVLRTLSEQRTKVEEWAGSSEKSLKSKADRMG
jgi:hypothetical protein